MKGGDLVGGEGLAWVRGGQKRVLGQCQQNALNTGVKPSKNRSVKKSL